MLMVMERYDSDDIRKKILEISYADWKKQGFLKVTLHQLMQKVKANQPFTLNSHIRERLEKWDELVKGISG